MRTNSGEQGRRASHEPRNVRRIMRWLVLGAFLALLSTFGVLAGIAGANGWGLRHAVVLCLLVLPSVGGLFYVAGWSSWWLCSVGNGEAWNSFARFAAGFVIWLAALFAAFWIVVISAFMPVEHEVDFEGERAVAEVSAFLDVNVTYYPYIDALFKGEESIGSEWYGSGGYDPFDLDAMPEPKRRTVRGVETLAPEELATSGDGVASEPPSGSESENEWGSDEFGVLLSPEEQAAKALAETKAAFSETGSAYRVIGTVTSQINSKTGAFSFRVDDGMGVLENGSMYRVVPTEDVRRLYGMKGLQWGMDGVVIGFAAAPDDNVLRAGVIIGNDDTSSAYWENYG